MPDAYLSPVKWTDEIAHGSIDNCIVHGMHCAMRWIIRLFGGGILLTITTRSTETSSKQFVHALGVVQQQRLQ